MRTIELTQGQFAVVDDEDFDLLSRWKWFAHWEKRTQSFYACRSVSADANGKKGTVWMHRQILGLSVGDGKIGDHINTEATLDNRRNNLRIVTAHQSMCNRRAHKNNRSGVKGISLNNGSYLVRIVVNRKTICLGRRKQIEDAKVLYAEGAKKYHGEFARTA
jgi:hypothetical protein